MEVVLGWWLFIVFLVLVIGLIKPALVKKDSRKGVIKLFLLLFLIWLGIMAITSGINNFLFFLCFVSIILLIRGLIRPTNVKLSSRKRVFGVMGSAFLVFFILAVVTIPDMPKEEVTAVDQKKVVEKEKEQKEQELAKLEEEKKQEQEAKAKELEEQKAKELEEQKKLEEQKAKELEEQKRLEEEAKAKELAEQKRLEEEAKVRELEEQKRKEEELAKQKAAEEAAAQAAAEQTAAEAAASSQQISFQNCTEMRKVHPNGVASTHPAYEPKHDRDKDNWACER